MATIRKSITFTPQQEEWIKLKVKEGLYTNESEYIRDLIRKDQNNYNNYIGLKNAIEDGLNSGVSKNSILDIIEGVNQKLSASK